MSEKKLALIATKGTLDWAYPPFILASTRSRPRLRGADLFHLLRTAVT